MRWTAGVFLVLTVAALCATTPTEAAPRGPTLASVIEGRDTQSSRVVLLLVGKSLTKYRTFELRAAGTTNDLGDVEVVSKSGTMIALRLPAGLATGEYDLALGLGRSGTQLVRVAVAAGGVPPASVTAAALDSGFRADLDDAATLGGLGSGAFARTSDVVPRAGGTMTGALIIAATGTSLTSTTSTSAGRAIEGRATSASGASVGVRGECASSSGDGVQGVATSSTGATRGVVGETRSGSDGAVGVFGLASSSSGGVVGVTGRSDSAAGFGVVGLATSATGAASGVAGTTSSSDSGATGVGGIATSTSGGARGVSGASFGPTGVGVEGLANSTTGVTVGVRGETASSTNGAKGMVGRATASTGNTFGVSGHADSATGTGVAGVVTHASGDTTGVFGSTASTSSLATGVYGFASASSGLSTGVAGSSAASGGNGVYGEATSTTGAAWGVWGTTASSSGFGVSAAATGSGSGSAALVADHSGSTGNVALFRSGSVNVARIDKSGRGYFNGGTATSGADFAESVATREPASELEPGDVVAIDPTGTRRFTKCAAAESSLVAGIYSTRPGVLARLGDVADAEAFAKEIPLAVTGIVPCKVCDEGGAIAAGDLLVAAGRPRFAKRAPRDPAPGTILAKALGALDRGSGVVEVLITMR